MLWLLKNVVYSWRTLLIAEVGILLHLVAGIFFACYCCGYSVPHPREEHVICFRLLRSDVQRDRRDRFFYALKQQIT